MKISLAQTGACVAIAVGVAASASSWCQAYPVKPVRVITSGPPGGGLDAIARPIAQRLSEALGQQFIVDNRPGGGGIVSAQATLNAPADGYTVLISTANGFTLTPLLVKKMPYNSERDFAPVTLIATAPLLAAVHPSLPVNSIKELVSLAKARPKEIFYASNGNGSIQHLTAEMLSQATGIAMVHVPYKGGPPAVMGTMGGHAHLVITAVPTVLPQVRASRLRALAVTSSKRLSAIPELPTVAESGVPAFESVQYYAMFARQGTVPAVVERLYFEIRRAAESRNVMAALAQEGAELSVGGPQALTEFRRIETARWGEVIRRANFTLE